MLFPRNIIHFKRRVVKIIVPVRCFSCGKPLGHLWEKYKREIEKGKPKKSILDELGLVRYCCRALFLGHVDLLETVAKFKKS